MNAVKKGRIGSHLRREGIKQAGCLEQYIHALIDIAHKNHRSTGRFFLLATGKGSGSHIVLHDLNAIFVLKLDTGNLVKGHAVPKADQTYGFASHIVKEIGNGGLTARHQNAVGRNLFVKMGFAGASRPQFAEVEVVLHKRQHTDDE